MADQRWHRVKELVGAALEWPSDERPWRLRDACGGDDALRRDVESLLAVRTEADGFLREPARLAPAEPARLAEGARLGAYEVRGLLGAGGMGEVYEAFDHRLKRTVAVKVVRQGHPLAEARLWREAEHASGLSHPNVCVVHEIGEADGLPYIVMERIHGRPLTDVIPEQGLPVAEALGHAVQIAGALAHAHERGLVHRDLKAANVMVTSDGLVKVLDFGLARRFGDSLPEGAAAAGAPHAVAPGVTSSLTAAGTIAGTLGYIAPEVLGGQGADARSDVWAAGVLLQEMLTGARPFTGRTVSELTGAMQRGPARPLPARVPRALAAVVRGCLEQDPDRRYASGRELDAALTEVQLATRRVRLRSLVARPAVVVPAVLLIAVLGGVSYWLQARAARERWARETALPEVGRLTQMGQIDAAFRLARRAAAAAPGDAAIRRAMEELTVPISVRTTPPGAEVFAKSYLGSDDTWESLGAAPILDRRVPFGYSRFRVIKAGFDEVEGAFAPQLNEVIHFTLDAAGSRPPGMVRVVGGPVQTNAIPLARVEDFWLDKHEVSNAEFRRFVDAGGYRRRDHWKQPFVLDGRSLGWEAAMARFVDSTGQPGPSVWSGGTYPAAQADHPVRGVSWYEAAAYADFAGKSLPTVYHWYRAAGDFIFTDILSQSNFSGEGPARVGSHAGITPYGNYDMAGNVKEWCWNEAGRRRYVLGGSWNEPVYMFGRDPDALSPFDRSPTHGFRGARYATPLPSTLTGPVESPERDYSKETPVPDAVFDTFRRFYAYDRGPLDAKVESIEETAHWRKERITFAAAYGGERMAAYLFLPRNARPPYQTVIWFPGVYARFFKSSANLGVTWYFDSLPRGGRAVLFPIYKGTYERGIRTEFRGPHGYREEVIQRSNDLGRSIDYLETRPDIDAGRLAYYGWSWGVGEGLILTAIEKRLKATLLLAGGLYASAWAPVEADPFHFAPRVTVPSLMMNGRHDFLYPPERSAVLLRLLGAPAKDKRLALFETGHVPPPIAVTQEIESWLDRHLGPVSAPPSPPLR